MSWSQSFSESTLIKIKLCIKSYLRAAFTHLFFLYSNFKDVCALVVDRAKALPKHQLVAMWQHCYLQAYEYLGFRKN